MKGGDANQLLVRVLQAAPEQLAAIERLLDGKAEPTQSGTVGPVWIRIRTAAVMLDAHRATVWRMVNSGRLTVKEILPGSFRVRRDEVEALAFGGKAERKQKAESASRTGEGGGQ
jgi:excisionase family DNA binding protein